MRVKNEKSSSNYLMTNMEISLRNFRCHSKSTYSLPQGGLVLISGSYGVGKTSLLNAIYYGFYGGLRRPYSHGKKECSVTLSYKGMKIVRTSGPNRLLLEYQNNEYEDDSAQKMIERILGMNSSEFLASSYVVQRKNNSVLTMTPSEQLRFVETLAFSKDQHLEYRKKFKHHVQTKKEDKIRCETELSSLETRLEEAKTKAPDSSGLKEIRTMKELSKLEESLRSDLDRCQNTCTTLEKNLKQLRKVEEREKASKDKIKEIEIKISQLEELRSKSGDKVSKEVIEAHESLSNETETLFNQTKAYEEYTEGMAKIKKMEKSHISSLTDQITKLNRQIPSRKELGDIKRKKESLQAQQDEYMEKGAEIESLRAQKAQALTKFKDVQKKAGLKLKSSKAVIRNLQNTQNEILEKIKETSQNIEEYKGKLIEDRIYECPSCSSQLRFRGKTLLKSEDVEENNKPKDEIEKLLGVEEETHKELQEKLQNVKLWIQDLEQAQPHLAIKVPKISPIDFSEFRELEKRLDAIKDAQESIKALKSSIRKKEYPQNIKEFQLDLKVKKAAFPTRFKPSKSSKVLSEELENVNEELDDMLRKQAERASLTREIQALTNNLTQMKRRNKPRKIKNKTSTDVENEISQYQRKMSKIVEELQQVSKYEKIQMVVELENKVATAKEKLEKINKEYEGALGLQEAGKEAEIQAVTQTLISINEHAKIYLDKMFQDPVQLHLENFRITKNRKLKSQMNTQVEYKGQIYSSVDELSGGEKQMCELAFLLAVNDMLGSPIILLDECLNNLDGDTHMDLLTNLRSLVEDKLVLVVSHRAMKGVFDSQIEF